MRQETRGVIAVFGAALLGALLVAAVLFRGAAKGQVSASPSNGPPVINLGTVTGNFSVPWTVPGTTVIVGYSGSTAITATLPTNVPAGVYLLYISSGVQYFGFSPAVLNNDGTTYTHPNGQQQSSVLQLRWDGTHYYNETPAALGSVDIDGYVGFPGGPWNGQGTNWEGVGSARLQGPPVSFLPAHISASLFALNVPLGPIVSPLAANPGWPGSTPPILFQQLIVNAQGSTAICATPPTVALVNCGAALPCQASPPVVGSLALTAATGQFASAAINKVLLAADYYGFELTAGSCTTPPTLDVTAVLMAQ
jgi:hypothetical protein